MRIVFDTYVLFAAFVAHGVCAGLYEECLLRGLIVVSPFILEELQEKLLTKAKLSPALVRVVKKTPFSSASISAIRFCLSMAQNLFECSTTAIHSGRRRPWRKSRKGKTARAF